MLVELLKTDAVPFETLHTRYGSLLELVRKLSGVVPNGDPYPELWPVRHVQRDGSELPESAVANLGLGGTALDGAAGNVRIEPRSRLCVLLRSLLLICSSARCHRRTDALGSRG